MIPESNGLQDKKKTSPFYVPKNIYKILFYHYVGVIDIPMPNYKFLVLKVSELSHGQTN